MTLTELRGGRHFVGGSLHCCRGFEQCSKLHKVPTTSQFDRSDGVLLCCSRSPQMFLRTYIVRGGGGVAAACDNCYRMFVLVNVQ